MSVLVKVSETTQTLFYNLFTMSVLVKVSEATQTLFLLQENLFVKFVLNAI